MNCMTGRALGALLIASTAHAIAPHLLKLAYDNQRDVVPVAFAGAVPGLGLTLKTEYLDPFRILE